MVLRRNIKKELLLVILLITSSALSIQGQKLDKMIAKEVQAIWEDAVPVPLAMDIGKVPAIEGLHAGDQVYEISASTDDEIKGYVLLTSALGRYDAFDYFLVFDETMIVQLVKVAVYRSAHGSAICSKRWLKQFVGYQGGVITYGKDVQAVTGATISGGSIVADVQRAQQLMANLKKSRVISGD